MSKHSI